MSKPLLDAVAFLLVRDNLMLIEKRKLTKRTDPGKLCIPSGGMLAHETAEEAMVREVREEFGVEVEEFKYLDTLIYHTSDVSFKTRYFLINSWSGEIQNLEAEELLWLPIEVSSIGSASSADTDGTIIERIKNS